MNVTIIQPPLVQLNTPYPSGAYLKSFFQMIRDGKIEGLSQNLIGKVRWLDLSTALFHKIFCRQGLTKLFALTEKKALSMADSADEETSFQLRRYVSCQTLWINWIDRIVEILCGGNSAREFCHEFVRSPHAPRGNRMENFFGELSEQGRDITTDDAKILASLALADLADYITTVFDNNFRLISYAEHLGTSTASFDDVIKGLKSPVLNEFYKDVLQDAFEKKDACKTVSSELNHLFLISVPFPGCFEAAVYTAREIRKLYGEKAIIATGGGYINTELRSLSEIRFFDYFDFISYDMGYGSYIHLLEKFSAAHYAVAAQDAPLTYDTSAVISTLNETPLYKMKYRSSGKIIGQSDTTEGFQKYAELESKVCRILIPDFSEINFSKYPRLADDTNPMHSIWNDGAWLKAYMAHGCYWHRCAFCDTQLEYVNRFCKVGASHLCDGLTEQAQKTGVWGIHFVDEACPPSSMIDFGIRNCRNEKTNGKKLTWWGNIRFEKTFTRDMADFLSYSGLTAVSGGIEIATGDGLSAVNKGTTMENIVAATCAFKEAGILVHSYMIFGFYQQSEQDLINSMETLRQLFAAGLLDSAFWHKFTLTLHSTVYKEWQDGKHPELKIITGNEESRNRFAENDLHFAGEHKSAKYSEGLNAALDAWMHGQNLETNVQRWFTFYMPRPTLPKDYIDRLIEKYEARRDAAYREPVTNKSRLFWLGGKPVVQGETLTWFFMGQEFSGHFTKAKEVAAVLEALQPGFYSDETGEDGVTGGAPQGASHSSPHAHDDSTAPHNAVSQSAHSPSLGAHNAVMERHVAISQSAQSSVLVASDSVTGGATQGTSHSSPHAHDASTAPHNAVSQSAQSPCPGAQNAVSQSAQSPVLAASDGVTGGAPQGTIHSSPHAHDDSTAPHNAVSQSTQGTCPGVQNAVMERHVAISQSAQSSVLVASDGVTGGAPQGAHSPCPGVQNAVMERHVAISQSAHSPCPGTQNAEQAALASLCSAKELIRLRQGGLCCL
ncbi:MAG: hypothetical protein KIG91_02995 [Treponema sp.]|nr:hypothetical protein [Treponema sp.]